MVLNVLTQMSGSWLRLLAGCLGLPPHGLCSKLAQNFSHEASARKSHNVASPYSTGQSHRAGLDSKCEKINSTSWWEELIGGHFKCTIGRKCDQNRVWSIYARLLQTTFLLWKPCQNLMNFGHNSYGKSHSRNLNKKKELIKIFTQTILKFLWKESSYETKRGLLKIQSGRSRFYS